MHMEWSIEGLAVLAERSMGRNTRRKDLDSVGVVLGSGGWKVIRLLFIR